MRHIVAVFSKNKNSKHRKISYFLQQASSAEARTFDIGKVAAWGTAGGPLRCGGPNV